MGEAGDNIGSLKALKLNEVALDSFFPCSARGKQAVFQVEFFPFPFIASLGT